MRKLLRSMAKAEMVRRGYSKVNRRIGYGSWRAVINAYPINLVTGKKMARNYRGQKKYPKGALLPSLCVLSGIDICGRRGVKCGNENF